MLHRHSHMGDYTKATSFLISRAYAFMYIYTPTLATQYSDSRISSSTWSILLHNRITLMYWKHSSSLWSGKANEGGQGKQNQKVDLYKQCKLCDVALKYMSERI